jgi:hypothetical protein
MRYPATPQPAKVAAATAAARVRRASRKKITKMAGVSFSAAASPTPIPAARPCAARRTSVSTSASRNRLTWPR